MSQGVCSHSTVNSQEMWVLHSVRPETTKFYEDWLRDEGVPHKVLEGRFNGQMEPSYLVPAWKVEDIKRMGWVEGQEYFLVLDTCNARGHRPAYLTKVSQPSLFPADYVGMFQHTPLGPRKEDDYTYDPIADQYFIVAPAHNASDKPLSRLSAQQREHAVRRQSAELA